MATHKNKHKKKCYSCFKIIQETQKYIECHLCLTLTCEKLFHAVSACAKSFDSSTNNTIVDMCQNFLSDTTTCTLDDLARV